MAYFGYESLLENPHNLIFIYSFSTQTTSQFSAFVTDFNDSFKSNWTTQEIYGKMDPVSTFKNTTRTISIAFDIPATDVIDSLNKMIMIDNIIKGLYPIYAESGKMGIATITAPPLFRIKFANYIINVDTNDGLLGYLNGFDFKPDMTAGHFVDKGRIFPKLFKASFNFNVLHEHPLGTKMYGSKPLPRITTSNGSINDGFAHKFDNNPTALPKEGGDGSGAGSGTTAAGSAAPPNATQPANQVQAAMKQNEIDLYTLRFGEGSGALFMVAETPIPEAASSSSSKETFIIQSKQSDGTYVLKNKKTGQIINSRLQSLGGSANGG